MGKNDSTHTASEKSNSSNLIVSFKVTNWRFRWLIHQSLYLVFSFVKIALSFTLVMKLQAGTIFEKSPCCRVQGHSQHLWFLSQQSYSTLLETQKTINKQERTVCEGWCEFDASVIISHSDSQFGNVAILPSFWETKRHKKRPFKKTSSQCS